MAETLKTRILLRSDLLSSWQSVNPTLAKGEVAVVYDPTVSGEGRKIRIKIGDGITEFKDLPYIADYDAELAKIIAEVAKKVDKELTGANGKAYIFNEEDGGGAKFVHKDGTESFVGVNDGGENGIAAQIYADKLVDGKWKGAKLDVTNEGIYYTVGDKSAAERDVEANEVATKGDIKAAALEAGVGIDEDKLKNNQTIQLNLTQVILDGGSAADWAD